MQKNHECYQFARRYERTRPDRNSESGFTNVTSIVIGKGEITRLLNIPSSVKKLHCSHNLFSPWFPTTELHINDNHVSSLDLKGIDRIVGAELLQQRTRLHRKSTQINNRTALRQQQYHSHRLDGFERTRQVKHQRIR
jgi:hypothetical protein